MISESSHKEASSSEGVSIIQQKQKALSTQRPTFNSSLLFFINILVLEIAIGILYGFFMRHYVKNYSTETDVIRDLYNPFQLQFIVTNILAVLGFGLLLVNYRHGIRQTLFTVLLVAAINVQLSPLCQKLWENVFLYYFKQIQQSQTLAENTQLTASDLNKTITIRFVRISAFCTISLLLALSSVIGRIGVNCLFYTIVIFNITFNLNYYANFKIFDRQFKQNSIFDDFQGSRVFSFCAGFGLALLIMYRAFQPLSKHFLTEEQKDKKRENEQGYQQNLQVGVFSLLGVGFVLCFFYYLKDPYYTTFSSSFGLFNIFLTFCSCILSSMAVSCIINEKISLHHINYGVLSGLIYISIIGTFIQYPFVALIIGTSAGIITSLLMELQDRIKFNKYIVDPRGFLPAIFASCIIGSFLVAPVVIQGVEANDKPDIQYSKVKHMIYTAISLGIGFGSGIIASLFNLFLKEKPVFVDFTFFSEPFRVQKKGQKPNEEKKKRTDDIVFNSKKDLKKTAIKYEFEMSDSDSRNRIDEKSSDHFYPELYTGPKTSAVMLNFD